MSIAEQLDNLARDTGAGVRRSMDRHGLTLAKITNITDPDKLNRVKCLPVGAPNLEETDWCYVMAPSGGPERGIFWFPRVDDLVVLAYLDDDPHRPLVIGSLWTTTVKPPFTIQEGKVMDYLMRTPSRIEALMHDEDKKHKLTLTMPSGATLVLDDENQKAELRDKEFKNALVMDFQKGEVTLKADSKLVLDVGAGAATITMEKAGNITIKASKAVSVEGVNIEEKASSAFTAEGATVEAKASGKMDLTATGPATIKGLTVSIN